MGFKLDNYRLSFPATIGLETKTEAKMITLPPAPLLQLDYTGLNTLIISDTHFGPLFDEKYYDIFNTLLAAHDNVIVAGDFWDSWYYKQFDDFLNSPWSKLFPQLLTKSCVYIPGNHDPASMMHTEGIAQFATAVTDQVELKVDANKFIIEHGHRYPDFEKHFQRNHRILKTILGNYLATAEPNAYKLLYKLFGNKFYLPGYLTINKKHRTMAEQTYPGSIYVAGHSHYGEYDPKSPNYVNLGPNQNGQINYLSINEHGTIKHVSSTY